MPEQLGSVLDCLTCTHCTVVGFGWEPLQLTALSLPLPSVRATRYAHVCTSIHKNLLLLDSCPTYCDRCPVVRGELSMNSQTSCLYTPTLLQKYTAHTVQFAHHAADHYTWLLYVLSPCSL